MVGLVRGVVSWGRCARWGEQVGWSGRWGGGVASWGRWGRWDRWDRWDRWVG